MRKDWELTEPAFDRFLSWLHPDRDKAGMKNEEIRRHLIPLNGEEWDPGYGYGLACATEAVSVVRTFRSPGEPVEPLSARTRR